jgi:hypothetical protein
VYVLGILFTYVVILGVEQEVGAHNGDADAHDDEDDEHQEHEPVYVVHLQEIPNQYTNTRRSIFSRQCHSKQETLLHIRKSIFHQ